MITLYRGIGIFLLVSCISSLLSFAARLIPELREPMFYLVALFCLVCGAVGMGIYHTKKADNNDWITTLYILMGFAIAVILGGAIQWSR